MTIEEINDAVKKFSDYLGANGVEKSIVFVAADVENGVGHFTSVRGFNASETIGIYSIQMHDRTANLVKEKQ